MFDLVEQIATAESRDLRELMKIAGGDPGTFYRGARLEGVNIKGQDLVGISFQDADFTGVLADRRTRLDEAYSASVGGAAINTLRMRMEGARSAEVAMTRAQDWLIAAMDFQSGADINEAAEAIARICRDTPLPPSFSSVVRRSKPTYLSQMIDLMGYAVREGLGVSSTPVLTALKVSAFRVDALQLAELFVVWNDNKNRLMKRPQPMSDGQAAVYVALVSQGFASPKEPYGGRDRRSFLSDAEVVEDNRTLARAIWIADPLPDRFEVPIIKQFLDDFDVQLMRELAMVARKVSDRRQARAFASRWSKYMPVDVKVAADDLLSFEHMIRRHLLRGKPMDGEEADFLRRMIIAFGTNGEGDRATELEHLAYLQAKTGRR